MPHPTDIHVGQKIRDARNAQGLSQEALGAKLGVSFQQVQKYEKGTNRVGSSRLWMISQALKVKIEYFFSDLKEGTEETVQVSLPRRIMITARKLNGMKGEVREPIIKMIDACADGEFQNNA